MSKFIPRAAVGHERNKQTFRQQKRIREMIASGQLVYWPDPVKGPYLMDPERAEKMTAQVSKLKDQTPTVEGKNEQP